MLKPGGFRSGVDREYDKVFPLADGLVSTDGVQYSSVASFGTLAVEVFSKTIDPGYTVSLQKLQVGIAYRLRNEMTDSVGSFFSYWTIQPEYNVPSGGNIMRFKGTAINIAGTYQNNLSSYGAASYSEIPLSGYVPVASIPYSPFVISLTCRSLRVGGGIAQVKNSSYVRLVGCVVPGT